MHDINFLFECNHLAFTVCFANDTFTVMTPTPFDCIIAPDHKFFYCSRHACPNYFHHRDFKMVCKLVNLCCTIPSLSLSVEDVEHDPMDLFLVRLNACR